MSWLNVVLWIATPWLVGKIVNYVRGQQAPTKRPPRPKTRLDLIVSLLLLVVAFAQVFAAFLMPPENILSTLDLAEDAPNFMIRSRFRDHMSAEFPGWTESLSATQRAEMFSPPQLSEIGRLETLIEKLRSAASRAVYRKFGHAAFVDCTWCVSSADYFLYVLPSLMSQYAVTLALLGAATSTWRRTHLRLYIVVAVLVMVVSELAGFLYVDGSDINPLWHTLGISRDVAVYLPTSYFHAALMFRQLGFFVISVLTWFFERSSVWTDSDILQEIFAKQQYMFSKSQMARLARTAALGDSNLRKTFMEYYSKRELERDAWSKDDEYKELREKTLKKFNIDKLVSEASTLSQKIIEDATNEGLLPKVGNSSGGED
ncbi:hypothetical protein BJ742DRAFT_773114 [Cladochytrium replicatum]|nr:hypothetical protein BJ742DRAFT_773114 [Cladochytrium replicatum]